MPVDILEAVAIEYSCVACKGRHEITLKQVLLSQQMLRYELSWPAQLHDRVFASLLCGLR